MKGIYLASYKALHETHDIIYQDINGKRDIGGDMMDVDLTPFDYIIATPPCNYYSRANYRRETSEYSQKTKHLLPDIIDKLILLGKPFIVENVKNKKLFTKCGLLKKNCNIYFIGRHTYWTNLVFNLEDVELMNVNQLQDVKNHNNLQQYARTKRQGGKDVHEVVEYFIDQVLIAWWRMIGEAMKDD